MSYVVGLAAAEAKENPKASEALKEFGSIRVRDAEQKAHQVLEKHGLTCPIKIDRVNLAEGKRYQAFPCIKFSMAPKLPGFSTWPWGPWCQTSPNPR